MSRLGLAARLAARFLDRAGWVIATAFILVGFLAISNQGHSLHSTQQQLALSVHNQVVNRAANVEAWCGGINEGRDYNRAFVKRVSGGRLNFAQRDLPCEALIRKTLESPKRKILVSPETSPITYRLLHQLGR